MPDSSTENHRFPARIGLRVPRGLPEALEAAARQRFTTPAEWARQTLLRGLTADGVRIEPEGNHHG